MPQDSNANEQTPESVEPTPVFERESPKEDIIPEELPEETPEDLTVSDIEGGSSGDDFTIPPPESVSFSEGGSKKYVAIGIGVVIVILLFIGILTFLLSLRGNKKEITLEYWGLWEDEQVFAPIIEEYHRNNPKITVKYVKQDPQSYREKLIARGKEGRGPDIFRFHNTWLPSIIEIAAPIPAKIMPAAEFEKTFYQVAQDDLKVDKSYHGLPLEIDGLVLVYNNDLFKKAGISTAPQKWEDVVRSASSLRVQAPGGDILTSGIALGTADNLEHFSDILGWMFIQNGADIRSLDKQEAVEVLRNYRRFAEPPLNFWNQHMSNNIPAFVQGKVAMIIVPSWRILEIKEQNPDLEIKVTKLPILPGNQPVSLATYWVEGVSRTSKNQMEAWKFLKYLTQKETMQKLYKEQSNTRLFGEPYSRVDLRDDLIQNEYIGPVLEQAPFMKSLPLASRTFDNGINDQIIKYLKDAVNATIQGVSYEQALDTASKGIDQVFKQYNIE